MGQAAIRTNLEHHEFDISNSFSICCNNCGHQSRRVPGKAWTSLKSIGLNIENASKSSKNLITIFYDWRDESSMFGFDFTSINPNQEPKLETPCVRGLALRYLSEDGSTLTTREFCVDCFIKEYAAPARNLREKVGENYFVSKNATC